MNGSDIHDMPLELISPEVKSIIDKKITEFHIRGMRDGSKMDTIDALINGTPMTDFETAITDLAREETTELYDTIIPIASSIVQKHILGCDSQKDGFIDPDRCIPIEKEIRFRIQDAYGKGLIESLRRNVLQRSTRRKS